jgi:hypothetical protein
VWVCIFSPPNNRESWVQNAYCGAEDAYARRGDRLPWWLLQSCCKRQQQQHKHYLLIIVAYTSFALVLSHHTLDLHFTCSDRMAPLTGVLMLLLSQYSNINVCNKENFKDGSWFLNVSYNNAKHTYEYDPRMKKELTFIGCVDTYNYVANHSEETVRHQIGYSKCAAAPSIYVPNNCKILDINESVRILQQHFNQHGKQMGQGTINQKGENAKPATHLKPLKIQVIGDSLGQQFEIAGRCILEKMGYLGNRVVMVHNRENYLRPDYPCFAPCINNKTFASKFQNVICHSCMDGIHIPYSLESSWYGLVENDTNIVILNTGAWYNGYLLGYDSDYEEQYTNTIRQSIAIADKLAELNIVVLWTSLPPVLASGRKFAWDRFATRNTKTELIAKGSNLHYFDMNQQILQLRAINPSIDYKGKFHFCNPSPSSVLTFMFRTMLSILCIAA